MIKTITNRLFLLVTMLLLSTVNALADDVAKIGNVGYTTLADAIAAVPDNGTETTIQMIANETLEAEAKLTVAAGKNIVLDLNGKTIAGSTAVNNATFYFLTNKGTLTVTDDSANKDGKITFTATNPNTGYSYEYVTIYNQGALTLAEGTIEGTSAYLTYAVNTSSNAWGKDDDKNCVFNMTGGKLLAPNGDASLRVYQNCAPVNDPLSHNTVNISGGYMDKGIFVDQVVQRDHSNLANWKGENVNTQVNIEGGTINGLIDMKIRHPFNTLLTISGNAKLTNAQLRVRKHSSEYATACGEPNSPMVNISGTPTITFGANNFVTNGWTDYNNQFALTGGTYNVDPSAYVADGYEAVDNNGTWTVQVAAPKVAQIGNVKYTTLQAAVDAASANDVIELLQNIDLTTVTTTPNNKYNVNVNKSITIDGKGFKITSSQGKRALALTGEGNNITLKNLTVVNNKADWGIGILNVLTATLDNTTIDATNFAGSYNQPLTIGSIEEEGHVVLNVINGSVIKTNDEGKMHYAILVAHPADIDVTESTIKGWAAVYVKPDAAGTNVSISNSTLESHGYSGVSNAFGMFVTECDGNSFTLTDNSYKLTAENNYDVLFMLKGYKNNTIQLLGSNNTFVSSDPYYGGLTSSWGDFYTNSLYMSEEAKNLFASYIDPEATINQVTEEPYNGLYKINYIPQVYYYWNTDNGPQGVYSSFAQPFTQGWLADGEFITINKDFALTSNIACQLTSGSFTLTQGEYSITKGEYAVTLNGGVSVITDKQTDIFAAAEGYKIQETVSGNTYTYKAVAAVVAQIGSVKYETLAEAFDDAKNGETITLLADCETGSNYDISKPLKIAYTGTTLDLNGKTITVNNNFSFCVTASNVTIKNGTIASGENTEKQTNWNSYILVIGGVEKNETISGVTIENVETEGGISVGGDSGAGVKGIAANTVIKDCKVLSGDYYAVCSQNESTVTINGGKYEANDKCAGSKVLQASFKGEDGPEGTISVVAGTFTGAIAASNKNLISITGGTYSVDPTAFVAEGYEAVAKDGKWTVGKIVVKEENLEKKDVNPENTQATYKVPATVQNGEEKIGDSAQAGKTVTVEIAAENNAATGAKLDDLNIANVLTKAITTEAAAGQNNINVSIAVVANDETDDQTPARTVVFEVHPEATVTVKVNETETSSTVQLANSDLAAGAKFTFTLNVGTKFADHTTVQVVHISDEFGTTTLPELLVVDGGKVTISEIEHFSSFQLSEVVPVNISDLGFATFSSTKAVDFTGIDAIHAYTATMNGKIIEFTRIRKVPANTGLLIRNPNGAKAVSVGVPVIDPADVENNYYLENNALVAVKDDIADGDLPDTDTEKGYSNFILNKVKGVVGFYRPNGWGVDAGRAYLRVLTSSVSGVQSFTNLFDGETTAIDSITTADEQTQDNVFYDLSGRRVNNPQRGLYIVNGKKVLVK